MKILTFNESIRNKMIPKSEEEISKNIEKLSVNEKLKLGVENNVEWVVKQAIEEGATITSHIMNKATTLNTLKIYNFLKDYVIKNKLYKKSNESHILRFDDIQNLEFRKGSLEHGDKVKQLIEFLLIYKNENEDIMVFNKDDFEKASKMKISEIEQLNNLPTKKSLFDFNIEITDNQIKFTNLQKRKSLHTESKILYLKDF
jgi:hypothetical protein